MEHYANLFPNQPDRVSARSQRSTSSLQQLFISDTTLDPYTDQYYANNPSNFDDSYFYDQTQSCWSEYQLQGGETFGTDEPVRRSTSRPGENPNLHVLDTELPPIPSCLDSNDDFAATLQYHLGYVTESPQRYPAIACMVGQPQLSPAPTPPFNFEPTIHDQLSMNSTIHQSLDADYAAFSNIPTMPGSESIDTFNQGFYSTCASDSGPTRPESTNSTPPEINSTSPFYCSYSGCNREFLEKDKLKRHKKSHTRPFQCPVCRAKFSEKKTVDRHLWAKHGEYAQERDVRCPMRLCPEEGCGKICRGDNLKRHMRLIHHVGRC